MNINAHPTWQQDNLVNASGVSNNVKRVREGSSEIVMSPLGKELSDEELSDGVDLILDEVALDEDLRTIESKQRSRLGPRSRSKAWPERIGSLQEYFQPHYVEFSYQEFTDYIAICKKELIVTQNLRPLTFDQSVETLIRSSSSGLPYLVKKGSLLPLNENSFTEQMNRYPCMLFTRTDEDWKTRNVWGYPLIDTIQENRYAKPFTEIEKQFNWRAALQGPEEVDIAVTHVFDEGKRRGRPFIGIDFSAYDSTVSPSWSGKAFAYIAAHFQPGFHAELYELARRFATIPIHTPDGDYEGEHGVPSGSSFTNTVDSIAQYLVLFESGLDVRNTSMQIQGDDSIYTGVEEGTILDAFGGAGFSVNKDKSITDTNFLVYLQRYYSSTSISRTAGQRLGGIFPLHRAINHIRYQAGFTNFERSGISTQDFYSIRTIMLLENCKHHPGFESFCRYVQSLDEFGLEFSEKGIDDYSSIIESKAKAGVLHSAPLKGIHTFETSKVLEL